MVGSVGGMAKYTPETRAALSVSLGHILSLSFASAHYSTTTTKTINTFKLQLPVLLGASTLLEGLFSKHLSVGNMCQPSRYRDDDARPSTGHNLAGPLFSG